MLVLFVLQLLDEFAVHLVLLLLLPPDELHYLLFVLVLRLARLARLLRLVLLRQLLLLRTVRIVEVFRVLARQLWRKLLGGTINSSRKLIASLHWRRFRVRLLALFSALAVFVAVVVEVVVWTPSCSRIAWLLLRLQAADSILAR